MFCGALFFIGRHTVYMLPVFTAGAAKITCSCYFVGKRTLSSIQSDELSHFPLNMNKIQIDKESESVTASLFGLGQRKAIYREGVGCTLVVEKSEEEIRSQKMSIPLPLPYDPDTLQWPLGNLIDSAVFQEPKYQTIKEVAAKAFLEKNPTKPVNTRAVIIIHHGHIVAEKYADGYTSKQPQLGWSMTKSFSNALIGILVKEGKLKLTNKGLLPPWKNPKDPRYEITLEHLMNMTSGLQWDESYFSWSPVVEMIYTKADMSSFAASFPLQDNPGKKWKYSSGTTNILFEIIKNATGTDYHLFPYKKLFHKIGMSQTMIELDASGKFVGSSFGWATPRDWARFGLLYLNEGVWEGEQILPKEWVKYSRVPSPQAPNSVYASQFWHIGSDAPSEIPADLYYAHGFEDQRVIIIPSRDLVIVRLGQTHFENFEWNDFISSILVALEK